MGQTIDSVIGFACRIIKLISGLYWSLHFVILNNNMEMISIKINTPGLLGSLAFPAVAILTFVIKG